MRSQLKQALLACIAAFLGFGPFVTLPVRVASADGFPGEAWCQVKGESSQRKLGWDGVRLWQEDQGLLSRTKVFGGVCEARFNVPMTFWLNSSQGNITVDGVPKTGKREPHRGSHLRIDYAPSNSANGFELVVIFDDPQPAPGPAAPPPPAAPAATVKVVVVEATSPVPWTSEGSCDFDGQRVGLSFFPDKGRLDMTDILDALLRANEQSLVQCHVQAGRLGTRTEVGGKTLSLGAGEHVFADFPAGTGRALGLAATEGT